MAGLKAARARGRKGGRPKVNQQKLNQAIAMCHSQRITVKEIQEATGVSAATIYRELKKSKISRFALFVLIFCSTIAGLIEKRAKQNRYFLLN